MGPSIFGFVLIGALVGDFTEGRVAFQDTPLVQEPLYNNSQIDISSTLEGKIRRSGCTINVNGDLIEPQPLFLIPGKDQFWNPTISGSVKISFGAPIEFFCTESFKKPFADQTSLKATCVGGRTFLVKGERYDFEELSCAKQNYHTARRTGESCAGGATLVEVGFAAGKQFLRTMLVCHDEITQSTVYVHHKLNPSSAAFQKYVARRNFIKGDFFEKKKVNHLYTQRKQKETFEEILDGAHEQYFNESKALFLARGHLCAKTDNIFGPQQLSSFYFINAAPQWQRFNAGNWERVEAGVRRFVSDRNLHVDCYTGTWGVSELPDASGVPQQLYLSFDENSNGQIPVPKLYYRVVVEKSTKRGIVLIGVNNPHISLEEIQKSYIICDDISEMITWVSWEKDDISKGYSYACEVNQFTHVVPGLPQFDVNGILY